MTRESPAGTRVYDVAVIGGGAAGLVAAARAAEVGARVVLLEKNRRPGVKILMSGGTRCNLTNARGLRNLRVVSGPIDLTYDPREALGARSIQRAFGPGGKFLGPALRALSVEDTISLFEAEGVRTKVEANGKVFPASDRAVDVVAALQRRLGRAGADLRCPWPVREVTRTDRGFAVRSDDDHVEASRVILALGGQSYPGCGTTGDGYTLAASFGHTIIPPRPALVPIRIGEQAGWVHELAGLTLSDASASVVDEQGVVLAERREAILFAHFGLTGPAILDVSRAVARSPDPTRLGLRVDVVPALRPEAVEQAILERSRTGKRLAASLLPDAIPKRLAEALVAAAVVPHDRVGPDLSRDERRRLVTACKALVLPIAGTLGFPKAEVTSGGVALDEVEPTSLESRLQPRLHFAGEVLDLDGLIGGYNFQAAWSTGWLAGEAAGRARHGLAPSSVQSDSSSSSSS